MNVAYWKNLSLLFAVLALCGCPGPNSGIPEPDSCIDPGVAAIDTLELGAATVDSVFEPWQDGEPLTMVIGPQGGAMFAMRLRLRGTVGDCIRQRTTVDDGSIDPLADDNEAIKIYEQDDGSYVTNDHWVILFGPMPDVGATIQIATTIDGVSETRSMRVQ